MSHNRWTPPQRERFLAVLRETANVSAAARAVGMSRSGAYQLRQQDEAFRAAWDEALEEALDLLEAELWRRALKGVARPVFYGGKRCGVIRSYSDQLGMFLLKAHRPERYGQLAKTREEDEEDPDSRRYLLDLLSTIRTRLALAEEEVARRSGTGKDEET